MKPIRRRWYYAGGLALAAGAIVIGLSLVTPPHPVAVIRVEDAAGIPVAGAVIRPDGLRPKNSGGHYMWSSDRHPVKPDAVTTDDRGQARIPYPFYVVERLETGELSFAVNHPDFVPDRPFRTVSASPPGNAPLRKKAEYWLSRLLRNTQSRPPPVVLQRGAIVMVSGHLEGRSEKILPLHAEVSGFWTADTNSWKETAPGVITCRRIPSGKRLLRLVHTPADGTVFFSDIVPFEAVAAVTNQFHLMLKPGRNISGRVEASVPRPVSNGRVLLEVWQDAFKPEDQPPRWHCWTRVDEAGRFRFDSLPPGRLEVIAICDGWISRSGPDSGTSNPQVFRPGADNEEILISMERTARFEVTVLDEEGKPLEAARVSFWPNVRWANWGATIFGSQLYNSADDYRGIARDGHKWFQMEVADFFGSSGRDGVAVVPNLPTDAAYFNIAHPNYELPVVKDSSGQGSRELKVSLTSGGTVRMTVRMQKRGLDRLEHAR